MIWYHFINIGSILENLDFNIDQDINDLKYSDYPDKSDIKMAQNEIPASGLENLNTAAYESPAFKAEETISKIDDEVSRLRKYLGEENIYSVADKDMWKRFFEFLKLHFRDFVNDGTLSIPLVIRYNFCVFIIAFIPGEVIFPIPSFYNRIIPEKVKKVQIIKRALERMESFFKFVKKRSKKEFIINFYFGRSKSLIEDFKILLDFPNLIANDPEKIIRFLLDFDIKSDGFQ